MSFQKPFTRLRKRQKDKDETKILQDLLAGLGFYERGMEMQEMKDILEALSESASGFSGDAVPLLNSTMLEQSSSRINERNKPGTSEASVSDSDDEPIIFEVTADVHHPMDYSPRADVFTVEVEVHHSMNYSPVELQKRVDRSLVKRSSVRKRKLSLGPITLLGDEEAILQQDMQPPMQRRRRTQTEKYSDDSGLDTSDNLATFEPEEL